MLHRADFFYESFVLWFRPDSKSPTPLLNELLDEGHLDNLLVDQLEDSAEVVKVYQLSVFVELDDADVTQ